MSVTATLFAQIVVFGVLVWFINAFLWVPMTNMMEERKKRIADGLAAAEKGKHDQELAEKRALEVLQNAKKEAQEIVNQAQKRATEIVEEARNEGVAERDRILTAAEAERVQAFNQAKEQLRGEVVTLAVAGAGRIIKKEIDSKTHDAMLKELVAQI